MSNARSFKSFALGAQLPPLSSIPERPSKKSFSDVSSDEGEERLPAGALLDYLLTGNFDIDVVQEMLEAVGLDLDMSDSMFGWTSLLFAANHGSAQLLDLLIRAGALPDVACKQGNVALHLAARGGHCQAVDCLIANKVDLDVQNGNGWTALAWSAINGCANVASRLLEAAANMDLVDGEGRTASMWAARHGHLSVIQNFLNLGFNLNARDYSGHTVLDHAIEHLELWFALHAAEKANLSLFQAVKLNDLQAVLSAIQARAHVNALDADGWTPLLWAATCGSRDLVKLLAQHGGRAPTAYEHADASRLQAPALRETLLNARKASEQLLVAAKMNDWLMFEEALSDGAWVNTAESDSLRSPLMWVAANGATDLCRVLVSSKAELEHRDCYGWTALAFAVCSRCCELVMALLDFRADLHVTNYDGENLMHVAASLDDPSMVWTLIDERCDMDVQSNKGFTPVQVAAHRNSAWALSTLMKYRADASVKDSNKRSLLGIAVACGHLSIVHQLLTPSPVSKKKDHKSANRTKPKGEAMKLESQASSSSLESKRGESFASSSSQITGSDQMSMPPEKVDAHPKAEALPVSRSSSTLGSERRDVTPGKNKKKREQKQSASCADLISYSEADRVGCPSTPSPKGEKQRHTGEGKKGGKAASGRKKLEAEVETPEKVKHASPHSRPQSSMQKMKYGSSSALSSSKSSGVDRESGKKSGEGGSTPEKQSQMDTPEKVKRPERRKLQEGVMPDKSMQVSPDEVSEISTTKEEMGTKPAADSKAKKSSMSPEKWLASKDKKGRAALSLAVQFGRLDIVAALLRLRAEINAVDAQGDSALMLATRQKSYGLVNLLLNARAAVGLRNKNKHSALDLASDPFIRQMLQKFWIESKVSRLEQPSRKESKESPTLTPTLNSGCRLRVEGLPVTLTADLLEMHLRDSLRQHTSTTAFHVEVIVAPISEKPRGYAYIDFANSSDADLAMQCDGSAVCGRTVRIFRELPA